MVFTNMAVLQSGVYWQFYNKFKMADKIKDGRQNKEILGYSVL